MAAPGAVAARGKTADHWFLGATTPAADGQRFAAFVQRLRELGWMEGRNVAIEVRWAEGRSERFAEVAAELVRLKVDIILTHNTPPVLAAKQATSVIPIVFASAGDPVGTGVVASLARPGRNITDLSNQNFCPQLPLQSVSPVVTCAFGSLYYKPSDPAGLEQLQHLQVANSGCRDSRIGWIRR